MRQFGYGPKFASFDERIETCLDGKTPFFDLMGHLSDGRT